MSRNKMSKNRRSKNISKEDIVEVAEDVAPLLLTAAASSALTYYLTKVKSTNNRFVDDKVVDDKVVDAEVGKKEVDKAMYTKVMNECPVSTNFMNFETGWFGHNVIHFDRIWFEQKNINYPQPEYKGIFVQQGYVVFGDELKCDSTQECGSKASELGRVGIMIAGNSGLPGGALAYEYPDINLEAMPKTQEENVLIDWLKGSLQIGRSVKCSMDLIMDKWGMINKKGSDHETIQGTNYYELDPKKNRHDLTAFRESWVLDNEVMNYKGTNFKCAIVFVAGPQANPNIGKEGGTVQRTYVSSVANKEDYIYFREMIKGALRAAFDSMIVIGVSIPIVATISTGIYAGIHGNSKDKDNNIIEGRIQREFPSLVLAVLEEKPTNSSMKYKRINYFQKVIIPRDTRIADQGKPISVSIDDDSDKLD